MTSPCCLVAGLSILLVSSVLANQLQLSEKTNQPPTCSSASSVCSIIIATSAKNDQPEGYRAIPQCACPEGSSCPSSLDNRTLQVENRQWYGMCQRSDVLPKCGKDEPYVTVSLALTSMTIHRRDTRFHCLCEGEQSLSQNPSTMMHEVADGSDLRSIVVFCPGRNEESNDGGEPQAKRSFSAFYKRDPASSSRLQKRSAFGNLQSFYKRGDQEDLADKRGRSGLSAFYKRNSNGLSSFYKREGLKNTNSEMNKLYLAAFGLDSDSRDSSDQKGFIDDQDEDLDLVLDEYPSSFDKRGLSSGSISSFYKRSLGNGGRSSFYKRSRGLSGFYKRGIQDMSNFYKRAGGVSAFYKRSPGRLSSFYKRSPEGVSSFYKRGSPGGLSHFYKRGLGGSTSSFYKRGIDGASSFYKRGINDYSNFYKRDNDIDEFEKKGLSSFYKRGLDGMSSFYKRAPYSGMSSFYKRGGFHGDVSSFYKRAPAGLSSFYKRGGLSSFYKRNGNEVFEDDNSEDDLIEKLTSANKDAHTVL